jgi:glyoxylate/hydroxypyruvate reductase
VKPFRLLIAAAEKSSLYLECFRRHVPAGVELLMVDDAPAPDSIDGLVAWKLPPDFLRPYRNLRVVFGLGAGVDAFLKRDDIPASASVVKLSDAGMADQMIEYALLGILHWQRQLDDYGQDQASARWQPRPARLRGNTRVTVLGMGAIGGQVTQALAALGYVVSGWRRSAVATANIRSTHGVSALPALLQETDVLINLLPSTRETIGLLDHKLLSRLPMGAYVVNASRGDQLDAAALLALLNAGHLSGALLDVFAQEPLPPEDPLWRHPRVTLTPHVAAITLPDEAAQQICTNLQKLLAGQSMTGVVNRAAGY